MLICPLLVNKALLCLNVITTLHISKLEYTVKSFGWKRMEQWRNNIGRGKPMQSETNPCQCHFVHVWITSLWNTHFRIRLLLLSLLLLIRPKYAPRNLVWNWTRGLRDEIPATNGLSRGNAIYIYFDRAKNEYSATK